MSTVFYVKVNVESDEFKVVGGERIKEVSLTSPAKNNRANAELTRKLGELLDSKVAIVAGHISRRKKLKTCLSEKELDGKFSKLVE